MVTIAQGSLKIQGIMAANPQGSQGPSQDLEQEQDLRQGQRRYLDQALEQAQGQNQRQVQVQSLIWDQQLVRVQLVVMMVHECVWGKGKEKMKGKVKELAAGQRQLGH